MNRYQKAVLIWWPFFLLPCSARSAADEQPATPEAVISRARAQGIWSEGTPPISLRGELQVTDAKGVLVTGGYTLDWVSPTQWRENIQFNGYQRLRVRDTNGYWQSSSLDYQPEIIFQLSALLHVDTVLKVTAKQMLGKMQNREKDGVPQQCIEVKYATGGTDRKMCFDSSNGTLLRTEYPTNEHQNAPEISLIEYGAFNTVGVKLIPFEIRAFKGRKIVAAVKVLQVTKLAEPNPELFVPQANAQFWAQCDDMKEAELANRVQPTYPSTARTHRESGTVSVYAVIESDGSLSHLAYIHRASPALDAAAVAAVQQWHYKPAVCGLTPIRTETSISVDFWLQD